MSEPTPKLIAELYLEDVLAARRMTVDEKFRAGFELFDLACHITMDGIRAQYPGAGAQQVVELLRERLALGERLEQIHDN